MTQTVDDFLEHYGVKGMKWGVRKAEIAAARSKDAEELAGLKSKAKTTKVSSLSNQELQRAITRMNLEKQFDQLNPKTGPMAQGNKFIKAMLGVGKTANEVVAFNNSPAGQAIRQNMNKSR